METVLGERSIETYNMRLRNILLLSGWASIGLNAQVVLDDKSFFVIDNQAKLILDDSRPEALMTTETGGYIISEEEGNEVIWNVNEGAGTYRVPFAKVTEQGVELTPVSFTTQDQISGEGEISFSTYAKNDLKDLASFNDINESQIITERVWKVSSNGFTVQPEGVVSVSEEIKGVKVESQLEINLGLVNSKGFNEVSKINSSEWTLLGSTDLFEIKDCQLSNGKYLNFIMLSSKENLGKVDFSVFDIQGKLITSETIQLNQESMNIGLSGLALNKGVYLISASNGNVITSSKVIVQ